MMLKHIVMMKLKTEELPEMLNRLKILEDRLLELKNHISLIREWQVGTNFSNRPTAMDIVLISGFANEEDLEKYLLHPKHVEVVSYIKEVVDESRVVDFWV